MAVTLADAIVFFKSNSADLEKGLDKAQKGVKGFSLDATKLIGGAVVGAAVAAGAAILAIGKGALNVSSDTKQAASDMAASLGLPIAEAEKFADVARAVYGKNLGESVGEAAKAVGLLAQQMGLAADDPALQTMTENALRLQKTFGIDVSESIGTVKNLMENFGISGQEAFDLIAAGNQKGLNASGDMLETINEYSVQFASGGATASEFFSIMESGFQNGMLGTDKAADAFKEFRVRIQDGSQLTADSLTALGLNAEEITTGLANGTLTASDAFKMVTEALRETDDKTIQFQAGVGLLGTQFEDLGTQIATGLSMTNDWSSASKGAIDSLKPQYTSFGTAMEAMWRRITVSVSPFTDKLLELVNGAMPAVMGAFDRFDRAVGPAVDNAGKVIDRVVNTVKGLFGQLKSSVDINATGPMQYWKDWAATNLPLLQALFQNVLSAIQRLWEIFGPAIELITSTAFNNIWTIVDTTMRTIGDLVTAALQILTGDFAGAEQTLTGIVQRLWDAIYGIVSNNLTLIKDLFSQIDWNAVGTAVMDGIKAGMQTAWYLLKSWFEGELQRFRNLLPFSEPKDSSSPLRGLGKSGKALIENFKGGMEEGIGALHATFKGGLEGIAGGSQPTPVAAGGFNITVHVGGDNATYEGGRAVGRGIIDEMRMRGA